MKWRKLGHIFCANDHTPRMQSYGRMPTPLHLSGNIFRIYFEARTANNTAYPYYLEFDIDNPQEVIRIHKTPLLEYGDPGTFDDNGITPFSIIRDKNSIRLYYAGWNKCSNVPFRNGIGLAISQDEGCTFKKLASGPVLGQDLYDPIFPTGPFILKDKERWRMWYTSFVKWETVDGQLRHYYNIKMRESANGINWHCAPTVAIDFVNKYEYAFVCRGVIKTENKYRMWYSFREQPSIHTYRIGYAESHDGIKWIRMDERVDLDVSPTGWDSEMICYPSVFEHKGRLYMLYNGNGYGQTGFGLAVLEG